MYVIFDIYNILKDTQSEKHVCTLREKNRI